MTEEKTPVVILGAGGFAVAVYEILQKKNSVEVIGCTDKALGISERSVHDSPPLQILGNDDILAQLKIKHPNLRAILGLGSDLMSARARLSHMLDGLGISPIYAVHPSASLARSSHVDQGTVIRAGSAISSETRIGKHCVINLGALVDHHCTIGNNVFIGHGVNIASYVEIEDNVVLEVGAMVNKRVKIGAGARVQAGSFVNTDVPEKAVVVGTPARVVRVQE